MTKEQISLAACKRRYVTALESALMGGVLSLSQRAGSWRRQGINVVSKWVITPGGARVLAYRVVCSQKRVA